MDTFLSSLDPRLLVVLFLCVEGAICALYFLRPRERSR